MHERADNEIILDSESLNKLSSETIEKIRRISEILHKGKPVSAFEMLPLISDLRKEIEFSENEKSVIFQAIMDSMPKEKVKDFEAFSKLLR